MATYPCENCKFRAHYDKNPPKPHSAKSTISKSINKVSIDTIRPL